MLLRSTCTTPLTSIIDREIKTGRGRGFREQVTDQFYSGNDNCYLERNMLKRLWRDGFWIVLVIIQSL